MALPTASDNVFPKVILEEGAAPATPASGQVKIYAKADGLVYSKDDAGTETGPFGGSGVADIVDIPTAETDDTLVLAPDGAGGVEFRAEAGGGGGITHTYLGTSTIGATGVNATQDNAYTKAITVPSGGGLLTSIELYIKDLSVGQGLFLALMLYDDDGSGTKPKHLVSVQETYPWPYVLYRVAATAGDARWLSLPFGRFLPAGVYHIGFEIKGNASHFNVYYDAGSDWTWSKGGNTFVSDAPGTSGTVYTLTATSRDYSLRAGLLT